MPQLGRLRHTQPSDTNQGAVCKPAPKHQVALQLRCKPLYGFAGFIVPRRSERLWVSAQPIQAEVSVTGRVAGGKLLDGERHVCTCPATATSASNVVTRSALKVCRV